MTKTWEPLAGRFAGYLYEISSRGRVRSCRRGWRAGRLLTPFPDKDGYLRVNLYDDARALVQTPVHSLVAEAFLGPRPSGMTVNHKDFNKGNNAVENLEYKTSPENTEHARAAGRMRASTPKRLATRSMTAPARGG